MVAARHAEGMLIAFIVILFVVIPLASLVWGVDSRLDEPRRPWRS